MTSEERFEQWRRTIGLAAAPVAFAVLWMIPLAGVSVAAHRLAAVLSAVVVLWITEAIPLPVTAMLGPALCKIGVAEYAPNLIKKTVVGAGHAEKDQVKHMVKVLLPRAELKTADSTDALAIAICHAQHRGAKALAAKLAGVPY